MGRLSRAVVACLFAATAAGASVECPVEPGTTSGPAWGRQQGASVACNGVDCLVTWDDDRAEATFGAGDVFGTLVRADGIPVHPHGLPICTAPGTQIGARVAARGTDFLVAWNDRRYDDLTDDIRATFVTPRGDVVDREGIVLVSGAADQILGGVAANGTDWLVAWLDDEPTLASHVRAARFAGSTLAPLDGPADGGGILIRSGTIGEVVAASDGAGFLVAWYEVTPATGTREIRASRVAADGAILDAGGIVVRTTTVHDMSGLRVTSDGTNWLVGWTESWLELDPDPEPGDPIPMSVNARRLRGTDGALLDGTAMDMGLTIAPSGALGGLAADASGFVATWAGAAGLEVTRLAPDGSSRGVTLASGGDPSAPFNGTLALLGGEIVVAWTDGRHDRGICYCDADVFAGRVALADGALLDGAPETGGILLTRAASTQETPAAASSADALLVAWVDTAGGAVTGRDILARRFGPGGEPLDASPIVVAASPSEDVAPSVASDGRGWLVTWQERPDARYSRSLRATRVRADGAILDPGGVEIATEGLGGGGHPSLTYSASVASDGTDYLVVWQGSTSLGRFIRDGIPDASTLDLGPLGRPRVAFATDAYLVAGAAGVSVLARRVGRDGTLLDAAPIEVRRAAEGVLWPAVAGSAGNGWLVAWQDFTSGSTGHDVLGARVAPDGTVLDAVPLPVGVGDSTQQVPAVAAHHAGWAVAWRDYRTPLASAAWWTPVGAGGDVAFPGGIVAVDTPYHERWNVLAATPRGAVLVHESFDDDPAVEARRVRAVPLDAVTPSREAAATDGAGPLLVSKQGSQLRLSWPDAGSACVSYGLYEGSLGDVASMRRAPLACDLLGRPDATGTRREETVTPGGGSTFYLVTLLDATSEGSSGTDSFGVRRPPPIADCRP